MKSNRQIPALLRAVPFPHVPLPAALPLALACAVVFGAGCATTPKNPAGSAKKETVPFIGGQKVERYEFPNGLKLLVLADRSSPTFAIQTWFRVGSRDEVKDYTGLAHLFEHLMFKRTKTTQLGEFDRVLEQNGAEDLNAFTSRDYTVYVQQLPKDKLDLILKLESDRMVNLVVDDEQFKTEREVVQNERRYRNENSPDGAMYQNVYSVGFTGSNYRWPVIGYEEDLARMTAKDAEAFYRKNYAPNHATIVIVGDVNPDEVASLVEKHYGAIPADPAPAITRPLEPEQKAPVEKRLKLNTQVQKMMIGYKVPPVSSEDVPSIQLLRSVLTSGKSSRLKKALVDSGIASGVEAYDLDDEDASLLIFHVNLQKGRTVEQAQKVLQREIAAIQAKPVPDSELEKSKNQLASEFYESLSSATEKAHFLGLYESITPRFDAGLKSYDKIAGLKAADVQLAARKYLKPENRTTIIGDRK